MSLASVGVAALRRQALAFHPETGLCHPQQRGAQAQSCLDRLCTACPAPLRNVFAFSRAQGWEDQASREPEWPVDIQYHLTPSQEHLPTAGAAGGRAS